MALPWELGPRSAMVLLGPPPCARPWCLPAVGHVGPRLPVVAAQTSTPHPPSPHGAVVGARAAPSHGARGRRWTRGRRCATCSVAPCSHPRRSSRAIPGFESAGSGTARGSQRDGGGAPRELDPRSTPACSPS
ncbi:unnamed protein product [Urochloa humidicola]